MQAPGDTVDSAVVTTPEPLTSAEEEEEPSSGPPEALPLPTPTAAPEPRVTLVSAPRDVEIGQAPAYLGEAEGWNWGRGGLWP